MRPRCGHCGQFLHDDWEGRLEHVLFLCENRWLVRLKRAVRVFLQG